ncbi:MAG: hypothetical protein JRJ49_07610, partial [Deltaproteobacteria bacterium]|nr:hypothetical protein [Deltaproteobacteria bacterium]
ACKIKEDIIKVTVNDLKAIIPNIKNEKELTSWFAANRIPKRKFNKFKKHGEKGKGNFPNASPLLCSAKQAQQLLHKAAGERIEELFNYDAEFDKVIVFKSENRDAVYHGFHMDKNSEEIPNKIKKLLKMKKLK